MDDEAAAAGVVQTCPRILGPAKPDQGWCSGVFGMEIAEVDGDGDDLSGAMKSQHLAYAQGRSFADPEFQSWESLGAEGIVPNSVEWAG